MICKGGDGGYLVSAGGQVDLPLPTGLLVKMPMTR